MSLIKSTSMLLEETVKEWLDDGGTQIAAALAYYAIFSLSPLLIIVSLALGLVMDPRTLESGLASNLQATLGQQAAQLIVSLLQHNSKTTDVIGTIVWFSIVIWGATGMFAQLQNALNRIWEVKAKPGRSPLVFVKDRFLSFGIVVLAAVALLAIMVLDTALSSLAQRGMLTVTQVMTMADTSQAVGLFTNAAPLSPISVAVVHVLQVVLTVAISSALIAVIFRVLPDVDIAWEDVAVGSIFTALLLAVGQFAVGIYLSHANIGSVFGAAGSLTVILVWVYYSAQILLFGAEFTQVWARHYGISIRPDADAVWANKEEEEAREAEAGRDWSQVEPSAGTK